MKLRIHLFLVAAVALAVGLIFLDEPKFGDDFTYWYHAFNLHERGMAAWSRDSFHQIRWPVWGVCWALQGICGPGLISYYGTPFLYLILGAIGAFVVGWKLFGRPGLAWACSLAFLFQPLLDTLVSRPMPDLGEGVFGAAAVLAWWAMMNATARASIAGWAMATGAVIFLAEENRLTGVFLLPLVVCLTVLFFRGQWRRLLIACAAFALLLGIQIVLYKLQFDRWDHFIAVNAGAKGRHGTEAVPIWSLPFRFLDTLSKGGPLAPFYAAFGVLGIWFGWRRFGRFGRVVVAWFVLMYLAYACAPQQLWPYRPMLRDADRFLAALAVPYGALAVLGLAGLIEVLGAVPRFARYDLRAKTTRHALLIGLASFGLLIGLAGQPLGNRGFFTLSYVHAFRAHMRALPEGTRVFTHAHMRALAHLVDADAARRITWVAKDKWITDREPELEQAAASADEFWYIRKLALLKLFKEITSEKLTRQPQLATYFDAPEREWQLTSVLAKDDTPDIVLYRKRKPESSPALILTPASPELQGLLPPLPYEWKRGATNDTIEIDWKLPEVLRGKLIRIEMEAASENREAFAVQTSFIANGKAQPAYNLKPYFFKEGGKEFVALPVPADAEACRIRVRFDKKAKWARVEGFRIVAETPDQSRGR
jgi:hypothetical protein